MTRRLLFAITLVTISQGAPLNPSSLLVYIGTSGAKAKGIFLSRLDPSTGALSPPELVAETPHPSFLVLHPRLPILYAANEVAAPGGKASPRISAFAVDSATGKLALLNDQPSGGAGPCHVVVDATGQTLAAANYTGGSIVSFPLGPDGRLGLASSLLQHAGASIHPQRQATPHPHGIAFDPANRFAFIADLGLDKVMVYRLDAARGVLAVNDPPSAPTRPAAGPRHLAVHPSGKFAWVINELDSTITGFSLDAATGALRETQVISTLPEGFTGANCPAEISLHPNGRFLYGSNRGHDSLVIFSVDSSSGALALVGHESTRGKWPRHFEIAPSGRHLLVANQNSDSVVVFRVNGETGRLDPTGHAITVTAPTCVVFAPAALPGARD